MTEPFAANDPNVHDAIAAFWRRFEQFRPAFEAVSSADDPIYGYLLEQLQEIDRGLFLEFCNTSGNHELIITADGDRKLFALAHSIVSAAPQFDNWRILALKPRLGFPQTTTWEGLCINIADVVFDPLSNGTDNRLGLRLFVQGISEDQLGDAHSALLRAIDHGLGEKEFAEMIAHTEVALLPDGETPETYIPLVELEKFINWRFASRLNA